MAKLVNEIAVLNSDLTIHDFMEDVISTKEEEESFYIMDIGVLMHQYRIWKENLPNVKPYYAVKCNHTSLLMETLSTLGVGFDCASAEEIRLALKAGAKPNEIVYANPTKPISHLKYAAAKGVSLMTFDSICELEKVKEFYPEAKMILRIKVDSTEGSCLIAFGGKFGCDPNSAEELLQEAVRLGLDVVGVSFHVGTGCQEPSAYERAINSALKIFSQAKKMGLSMTYLDIGGGYPGDSRILFEQISKEIHTVLENAKDRLENVNIIAEPGRFFACRAFTIAAAITSLRESPYHNIYFLNNGIYTSFNCVPTEKAKLQPIPLNGEWRKLKKCTIWGQTVEEADKIVDECWLPEMKTGDWLYFTSMGAYSTCLSVQFHGFNEPNIYPVIYEKEWLELQAAKRQKEDNKDKTIEIITTDV